MTLFFISLAIVIAIVWLVRAVKRHNREELAELEAESERIKQGYYFGA